jgi:Zn-dependent metalloprotease
MRIFSTILLQLGCIAALIAQNPMKQMEDKPFVAPQPLQISNPPGISTGSNRLGKEWTPSTVHLKHTNHKDISSFKISPSGSFWVDLVPNDLWSSRASVKSLLQTILPVAKENTSLDMDWNISSEETDARQVSHVRVQQTLAGVPIHGQDMILHIQQGSLRDVNGFAWTGKLPTKVPAPAAPSSAIEAAENFLKGINVRFQDKPDFEGIAHAQNHAQLVWYPLAGNLRLAYEIDIHPNMMDHWKLFVDATNFEVMESYSELCSFAPMHLFDFSRNEECTMHVEADHVATSSEMSTVLMDGPTTVSDQDLKGISRTVNGYQVGSNIFMIDASRPGMFESTQSVLPNEPIGVIWTVDALNSSPQQSNFEVVHVTNTNNNWTNLQVSAHYNGGEAYEYFRQKFNRNSINGSGGNIISIINVTDENDNDMDNAFWNGAAIFYGNGDVAFQPLAKGLDVAGHEMSHGVIQNTANLEYVGQSGALNESYADIFGAMIDREDWQLGEDVVNLSAFPTGTMRDLSNPNNGGNSLGDPGWQPAHMNEFQNLPNTPQGDNGGVHVNSGIPNKAFFLLATAIGKDKAEQIYYKALKDYLVKSSQFVDMRNAAEKAAGDLHGTNSAEVTAVRNAFGGVGIGAGAGEDYEEDIELNDGDDFILATDASESDLYWIPPGDPNQFVKMDLPTAPISRPSFTDDGSACVYVDDENNMIVINFDWSQGLSFEAFYLEDNPQGIWRNVVVSKDGSKLAYTTSNLRNEIFVFDFVSGANDVFELFNPTTASGGASTGDVLYADFLEWDYSGDYVMYDALNRIESSFGDGIEYWDISFLEAWNNASGNLGTGQIGKLFSALPENISVGNPSFAKNSPYIIVFDFLETYYDIFGQEQVDYRIKAANIEAGEVNDIYGNTTIGYPNYSRLDDKILFTYDNQGTILLATIDVQNSNKTLPVVGTDVILINGAQKGVWFTTGDRDFTATEEISSPGSQLNIYPQPSADFITWPVESIAGNVDYTIFDLSGRTILHGNANQQKGIEIQRLLPGTYFLNLRAEDGSVRRAKFVKQ